MAFIEILKDIVNWLADPKVLITLAAVFLFASLKWPEKFYSDAAAKIPNARAALSPTMIINAAATMASRICVCET